MTAFHEGSISKDVLCSCVIDFCTFQYIVKIQRVGENKRIKLRRVFSKYFLRFSGPCSRAFGPFQISHVVGRGSPESYLSPRPKSETTPEWLAILMLYFFSSARKLSPKRQMKNLAALPIFLEDALHPVT